MDLELIPRGTRVEKNGDGAAFDISASATRTFICTQEIIDQIEQESLDLSVWGSADGEAWGTHPIIKLPQAFYKGEERMVLDMSMRPDVKFIRAHWDVTRWGRVAPFPMFVIALRATEIPAMPVTRSTPHIAVTP